MIWSIFLGIIVPSLVLVNGDLEEVLADEDLHDKFSIVEFASFGQEGKVYQAIYNGDDSSDQYDAAIKMVSKDGNEDALEKEIKTMNVVNGFPYTQEFVVAFKHCGGYSLKYLSDANPSEGNEGSESGNAVPAEEANGNDDSNCSIWIVSRWVKGRTVFELVEKGQTFNSDEAREFGSKLFEAILEMHKQGIVHADLDSSNIILGPDNTPTIIDFGEAETVDDGWANHDVVGLAVTLIEMITGVQKTFDEGVRIGEKCEYLQSVIYDGRIDENLQQLCKDMCERCVDRCTAMDLEGHDYFSH